MGCYGSSGENETRAGAKTAARLLPAVAQNRSRHAKFLFLAGAGLFGFPPCAPLPDLGSRRRSSGADPPCPGRAAPRPPAQPPPLRPTLLSLRAFPQGSGACPALQTHPSTSSPVSALCSTRQGSAPSLLEMPPATSHSLGLVFPAPSAASSSYFTMQGRSLPMPRGPQPVTASRWWQPSPWARGPWPDLEDGVKGAACKMLLRAAWWLRVGFLGGRSYLSL